MTAQRHPHLEQQSATESAAHQPTGNQLIEDILDLEIRWAPQQPIWENPEQIRLARELLVSCTPLVQIADVDRLHRRLSEAARGELLVLQAGDCAEDPAERTAEHVAAKTELLERLADKLERAAGVPVLRVGRIAGQFAKPRSKDTESIDGVKLPIFRGQLVNSPEPISRAVAPTRCGCSPASARPVTSWRGWVGDQTEQSRVGRPCGPATRLCCWTTSCPWSGSIRRQALAGSTHWPWIGERTRQLDGRTWPCSRRWPTRSPARSARA